MFKKSIIILLIGNLFIHSISSLYADEIGSSFISKRIEHTNSDPAASYHAPTIAATQSTTQQNIVYARSLSEGLKDQQGSIPFLEFQLPSDFAPLVGVNYKEKRGNGEFILCHPDQIQYLHTAVRIYELSKKITDPTHIFYQDAQRTQVAILPGSSESALSLSYQKALTEIADNQYIGDYSFVVLKQAEQDSVCHFLKTIKTPQMFFQLDTLRADEQLAYFIPHHNNPQHILLCKISRVTGTASVQVTPIAFASWYTYRETQCFTSLDSTASFKEKATLIDMFLSIVCFFWTMPSSIVGLVLGLIQGGYVRMGSGGSLMIWIPDYENTIGGEGRAYGNVLVNRETRSAVSVDTVMHEHAHFIQSCLFGGPVFPLIYAFAGLYAMLKGGNAYDNNYFEENARAQELGGSKYVSTDLVYSAVEHMHMQKEQPVPIDQIDPHIPLSPYMISAMLQRTDMKDNFSRMRLLIELQKATLSKDSVQILLDVFTLTKDDSQRDLVVFLLERLTGVSIPQEYVAHSEIRKKLIELSAEKKYAGIAYRILASSGKKELMDFFAQGLATGDIFVRTYAIIGLGNIESPQAMDILLEHYAKESNKMLRDYYIISGLVATPPHARTTQFLRKYFEQASEEMQAHIVDYLLSERNIFISHEEKQKLFVKLFDPSVQKPLQHILWKYVIGLKPEECAPYIIQALDKKNTLTFRVAAIHVAYKKLRQIPGLISLSRHIADILTENIDKTTKIEMLTLLSNLGDTDAWTKLKALWKSADKDLTLEHLSLLDNEALILELCQELYAMGESWIQSYLSHHGKTQDVYEQATLVYAFVQRLASLHAEAAFDVAYQWFQPYGKKKFQSFIAFLAHFRRSDLLEALLKDSTLNTEHRLFIYHILVELGKETKSEAHKKMIAEEIKARKDKEKVDSLIPLIGYFHAEAGLDPMIEQMNGYKPDRELISFIPHICQFAQDPQYRDRIRDAMLGLVQVKDPFIRLEVIKAFIRINDPSVIPTIQALYEKESLPQMKMWCLGALYHLGKKEALQELLSMYVPDEQKDDRIECLEVLMYIQSPEVLSTVEQWFLLAQQRSYGRFEILILRSLCQGIAGQDEAYKHIRTYLCSDDPKYRLCALTAAMDYSDKQKTGLFLSEITPLLAKEKDILCTQAIVTYLSCYGGPDVKDLLIPFITDANPRIRTMVLWYAYRQRHAIPPGPFMPLRDFAV